MSSPGIHVFTWCTCPLLAYVSSPGVRLAYIRPQLVYVSSSGEYVFTSNRRSFLSSCLSPLLGMYTKNHASIIPCSSPVKAWTVTSVWTDDTMPCLSSAFHEGPHQKLFIYLNETKGAWLCVWGAKHVTLTFLFLYCFLFVNYYSKILLQLCQLYSTGPFIAELTLYQTF